jgi:hypothetical protein
VTARQAERIVRLEDNARLREEAAEYEQLTGRISMLLTATANALKGNPSKGMLHDWSDLPWVARAMVRRAGKVKP